MENLIKEAESAIEAGNYFAWYQVGPGIEWAFWYGRLYPTYAEAVAGFKKWSGRDVDPNDTSHYILIDLREWLADQE